jgi:two-component system, sensor histidine kinase and response regulator
MTKEPLGRLLIVDDELPQMEALCNTLQTEGYQTTGYSSARRAVESLEADQFDLVLTDLMMPEMDGISLLKAVRQIDSTLAGVIMTGHGTIDTAVKAMQVGALDYVVKPFRLNVILTVVARALDLRRLRLENAALQERERQYVAELEAANKQLETFSFSVSHDLRAPLHTISGFCDLYLTQFEASIPDEGRDLLNHVMNGAKRMNILIEDLLRFCRFSRQSLVKCPVHIEGLVRRTLATLQATAGERVVELRIGQFPACEADPSLLEQVFVNLLSNAFKFTRHCNPAEVEVGSFERHGEVILFVRDNGAGFDMKHAGKLFGVFKRLHSTAEFEGTGVGLSIVQQIVTRHGGRIWADSAPNEGTTFYFTLAPQQALACSA